MIKTNNLIIIKKFNWFTKFIILIPLLDSKCAVNGTPPPTVVKIILLLDKQKRSTRKSSPFVFLKLL